MLAKIIEHRSQVIPPQHLAMAADILWKPSRKNQEFLDTNCELTCYAIRDLLIPGQAWDHIDTLPNPRPWAFGVAFGEFGTT